MGSGAQNMKTGPDALGPAENESGSTKHKNGSRRRRYRRKGVLERKTRKWDTTPSLPPKMSPGAKNMKTAPDGVYTVENGSESVKHENCSRHRRYRRK
jgi:hypothetical protein